MTNVPCSLGRRGFLCCFLWTYRRECYKKISNKNSISKIFFFFCSLNKSPDTEKKLIVANCFINFYVYHLICLYFQLLFLLIIKGYLNATPFSLRER